MIESGGDPKVGRGRAIFGILTISDRASAGVYEDQSGPEILNFFQQAIQSRYGLGMVVT